MDAPSPTIGAMKKYMGDAVTAEVLTEIIMASLTVLNLEKSVTPQQMKYTAILLMQENPLMKLSDWQTCLKMGVMGQYGEKEAQIYGRIDISTLSTWQRLYWEHRMQIGKMKAKIQRNTAEAENKSYAPPPEILSAIRERTAKLDAPKKEFRPDENMIRFWRSEWEAIEEPRPDFETYQHLQTKKLTK